MKAKSFFKAIPRRWKTPKTLLAFFVVELLVTVTALALYGIAAPDLYRTKLWQEGSNHGWNSNPNKILYDYANYRPIHYPLPWDVFTTNFNVIISVLSLFLLLVKGIMFVTHVFLPLVSVFLHSALVALYAVSIRNQTAPDMTDPKKPQPGAPWYITKSCGAPVRPSLRGYCMQAKGAFAVTVILFVLFLAYVILALYSLYPTRAPKSLDEESQRPWEMTNASSGATSSGLKTPATPRTMAFNTLSGKEPVRRGNQELPLRHHISMGDETYAGPSAR